MVTGPAPRQALPAALALVLVLGLAAGAAAVVLVVLVTSSDDDALLAEPVASPPVPAAARPRGDGVAALPDPAWLRRVARATEIPERVVAAYAGASLAIAAREPACGLGWNTLAAIGSIESVHGAVNGASVDATGQVVPPITGIPLDGEGPVAAIEDTDDGRLDGDRTWDRAVGPMQFIPTTWEEHAVDGDGDGTPDVHQIDDAVLTAAAYLCVDGADLGDPEQWTAAILRYNRSAEYVRTVAETATTYAEVTDGLAAAPVR